MTFTLRKSKIDPTLYEVVNENQVIQEIPIAFRIFKIPRSFVSSQAIEEWIEKEEKKLAKQLAYRLLNARNQTTSELKKKLTQRGISTAICQETVTELQRLGYVSDSDFERALIEKELRKGRGPLYIEAKLRSLGLVPDQVRKIVTDPMQREAIRKWIPKLRNPAPALQRRGFDIDVIVSELRNFSH